MKKMKIGPSPIKNQLDQDLPKILKGAAMTLSGNMSGKVLLFLLTLYIARTLGAGEVGIYFLGLTIIHVMAVIALAGMDVGIVRYVAIYTGRKDAQRVKGTIISAIVVSSAISWVIAFGVFAASDFCSVHLFHKPELGTILKLLSFTIPFETFMKVMLAVTRGLKLMQYAAFIQNVIWIGLRLVLTIVFVGFFKIGLVGVVWAYLASSVIAASIAFYYANRSVPFFNSEEKIAFNIKELINFSVPMVFTVLIYDVMCHIDVLMLGVFLPAEEIGIYTVTVRMLSFAQVIFVAFQPIFQPFVAELHDKKEFDRLSGLLKNITHWSVSISLPFFLSLLVFPGFFLSIFGQEFEAGSACLIVLTVAFFVNAISNLPASMLFMAGRSDLSLKNNLLVLSINALLNYVLIPAHGLIGAAYATGASFLLLATIRIAEVYHLMALHPFRPTLIKPFAAGLISFLLIHSLGTVGQIECGLWQTSLMLLIGFIIYSILLIYFRLNPEEREVIDIVMNKFGIRHKALRRG